MNKRSLQIGSRKTSITVEDAFWDALKQISTETSTSVKDLITGVDRRRDHPNLSSAVRLFVLEFYRARQRQDCSAPREAALQGRSDS